MGAGVARQCSRNRCLARVDGLGPPLWPPKNRSSELEDKTWSRGGSQGLVPYSGRPGPRRREVHFRLTSSRCHRRSVWGVTMNEAQRSRESALLADARNARSRSLSSGRRTERRSTLTW
jgi:hypothetical protein